MVAPKGSLFKSKFGYPVMAFFQSSAGCGSKPFWIPFWLVGEFASLEPILVVGLGCSLGVRFGFCPMAKYDGAVFSLNTAHIVLEASGSAPSLRAFDQTTSSSSRPRPNATATEALVPMLVDGQLLQLRGPRHSRRQEPNARLAEGSPIQVTYLTRSYMGGHHGRGSKLNH